MIRKFLYKNWLKFTNKDDYINFKISEDRKKRILQYEKLIKNKIESINKSIKEKSIINFAHSGHLGDIIYSLPLVKELSKSHKCNFYVKPYKKNQGNYFKHPSGKFFLDERLVKMLLPLLREQKFINTVEEYNNQKIEIDLDLFREVPMNLQYYSPRWFFHLAGLQVNLEKSYLDVSDHKEIKNKIVILRTFRARNFFINYKFLRNNNNLLFVGMNDEYEDLKEQVPNLKFYNCKNFLEMAQIIKSSKFFIGNQGIGYAIAEGLKTPRLLEGNPDFPVIFPIGENAYDFYHQIHFESFFEKLNN